MATQHIRDVTWKKIESETVKAVIHTKANIRTAQILDLIINLGLQQVSLKNYEELAKENSHKISKGGKNE